MSATAVGAAPVGAPAVSAAVFREALARVATPVAIVTTTDSAGMACGVTVGTLCSLSLTPPLVMFCLSKSSRSHRALTTASRVLIHVLHTDQAGIAARFAQAGTDRFRGLSETWHGLPTIPGSAVRLACARHAVASGGDHSMILCLVEDAETGAGRPLLYYARHYCAPWPLPAGHHQPAACQATELPTPFQRT